MALPMSLPMPKVSSAAASPITTRRVPEKRTLPALTSVMGAPMPNSASVDSAALAIAAVVPAKTMNGGIGTVAPIAKSANEVPAPTVAEPPSPAPWSSRPPAGQAPAGRRRAGAPPNGRDSPMGLGAVQLVLEIPPPSSDVGIGHRTIRSPRRAACRVRYACGRRWIGLDSSHSRPSMRASTR